MCVMWGMANAGGRAGAGVSTPWTPPPNAKRSSFAHFATPSPHLSSLSGDMSRNPRQRRERRAKMSEEDEMAFYEKRFRERNPNFRRGTGGAGVISMNTPALVESMLDLAEMNPYDIDSVTDKDAVALSLLDDPTLPDEDRAVLAAALRRKGVLRNRPPPSSSSAVRGRGRGRVPARPRAQARTRARARGSRSHGSRERGSSPRTKTSSSTCPGCNQALSSGSTKFCVECGTRLAPSST